MKKLLAFISVFALAISFVLSMSSFTGNAIANLNDQSTNLLGVCLFCLGLVSGLIWLSKK